MGKLQRQAMNLKQFLMRLEVMALYRDIFRTLRLVSDKSTRLELREWARTDFKKHKDVTDDYAIKSLVYQGNKALNDLKKNLQLSGESDLK